MPRQISDIPAVLLLISFEIKSMSKSAVNSEMRPITSKSGLETGLMTKTDFRYYKTRHQKCLLSFSSTGQCYWSLPCINSLQKFYCIFRLTKNIKLYIVFVLKHILINVEPTIHSMHLCIKMNAPAVTLLNFL